MRVNQNFNSIFEELKQKKQFEVIKVIKQQEYSHEVIALKNNHKYLLMVIDHTEEFDLNRKTRLQECQQIAKFLKQNTNQNIIKYYKSFVIENYFFFVLQNQNMSLQDLLNSGHKLSQKEFTQIAIQILVTTYHLHLNNYFLSNLSAQNVFIDQDLNIILKDFGIAKQFNPLNLSELYSTNFNQIPLLYLSPEVYQMLNSQIKKMIQQNQQLDVWMIGAFLYSLNDPSVLNLYNFVQGKSNYKNFDTLDDFTNQTLLKMLDNNEQQRPSIMQIIRDLMNKQIEIISDDQQLSQKTILIVIELLFSIKQLDECQYILQKLIDKFPKNDQYLAWLGRIASSLNDLGQSVAWSKKALEINSNNELAYANLGVISSKQGDLDQAINYYAKALDLKPDFDRIIFNIGLAYDKQQKTKDAIKFYSQAIKLNENFLNPLYNLANIYHNQANKNKAYYYYKQTIKISKEYDQSINNLAVIYFEDQKYEKAIKQFKKAKNLRPNDTYYQQNLKGAKKRI
ncbi:hypothetical protein ABPG72_018637 [Tetrahymena utriculariae]